MAAIVFGVIGCGNPDAQRLRDSRAQIQVAWVELKPFFTKRYEHLPIVISAYDANYHFSDGTYTGDPRIFEWSDASGQGIDIYKKFPEMRVSNNLKDHLKQMATGSLEGEVSAANAAEQDLLGFIAAANLIPTTADSQELKQAKEDIAKTQADLTSAAANFNALIGVYDGELYRCSRRWFSKRLDLTPIGAQLSVAVGVASQ